LNRYGVNTKVYRIGPPNRAGLRDLIEVTPETSPELPRLPRYVQMRRLADGSIAYYWCRPWWARGADCALQNEALGKNLDMVLKRSDVLNGQLDAWRTSRKK
jgi:hypothetical protein